MTPDPSPSIIASNIRHANGSTVTGCVSMRFCSSLPKDVERRFQEAALVAIRELADGAALEETP
jgi:hypothetical protein